MPFVNTLRASTSVSFGKKRGASGPNLPAAYGAAFGGGFFAGQISTSANGVATHNLVIAPSSVTSTLIAYKTSNSNDAFADSRIDGPGISSSMNSATYPAGQYCENLSVGGFSDWYLPALDELGAAYINLKPYNNDNTDGGVLPNAKGINTYSVPQRATNYSNAPRSPGQTTSAAFQGGGSEQPDFFPRYWSSTQDGPALTPGTDGSSAVYQQWYSGVFNPYTKNNTLYFKARAMRRIAV